MNKEKALTILEIQRDAFLIGLDKNLSSDYDEWCIRKSDEFQEVIDWIKEIEELEE